MFSFKIDWAPNEVFLNLGPITIYWYSVMFIIAFSLGYYIVQKIYKNDKGILIVFILIFLLTEIYNLSLIVREITSNCCSLVNLVKFTA